MNTQKPKRGYQCWILDDSSRSQLLSLFPPSFSKTVCHHVTCRYGVMSTLGAPPVADINVVGYAYNEDMGIECLVVEVDGSTKRSDGKVFHITLSLDPEKAKPVDSNRLLETHGWEPVTPLSIKNTPAFV